MKTQIIKLLFCLLANLLLFSHHCLADWNSVYQYGVELEKNQPDSFVSGKTSAFLWVPVNNKNIRAIVLAPANIIERRFCDDPIIRAEAEKEGFALLFFQAGWRKDIYDKPSLPNYIRFILEKLSEKSGIKSLTTIPWIPIGHSGNSTFCGAIARMAPEKILADIVIKGGMPVIPKNGDTRGIDGIPIMFVTGEFEEVMPPGRVRNAWWDVSIQRFRTVKEKVPKALYCGIEDFSRGHISWLPDMSRLAALYIRKAMKARLNPQNPQQLNPVSFESGWLFDPNGKFAPAPVNQYKGIPDSAFWLFDAELAKAWQSAFARDKGKKEQLLAFTQGDTIAPWWKGWGVQEIAYKPLEDGRSFTVSATFRDSVPSPFADAGKKTGHSKKGEVEFSVVGWAGATEQTGPNKFKIRYDREGVNGRTNHIVIAAQHKGDDEYRETVAAAHFYISSNNEGKKQTLDFPKLPTLHHSKTNIPLMAKTDTGLPVDYYVSWGPAEIVNGELHLTSIPSQAEYPIEIKVAAYQPGTASGERFAASNTVSQTIMLVD